MRHFPQHRWAPPRVDDKAITTTTNQYLQYGDPLLDQLDIHNVVHHRLFRESCYNHQGNYVKVRSTSSPISSTITVYLTLQ